MRNTLSLLKHFTATRSMELSQKEWFIQVPWGKLAVMAWGDSVKPPALLVHGKLDTVTTFRSLVQHLPDKYYYIGYDLPGNGLSDMFPKGLPIHLLDYVITVRYIVQHFRWNQFIYIGASLGSLIGTTYNATYPGLIERMVHIDPIPAYQCVEPEQFSEWFHHYYHDYFMVNYHKYNGDVDTAPVSTYQQLFDQVKSKRELDDESTRYIVDRIVEPVDSTKQLYRYTFDQRGKNVIIPPTTAQQLKELYYNMSIPLHTVLASDSVEHGFYDQVPFVLNGEDKRRQHYTAEIVDGPHDVHITRPSNVASSITQFLNLNFDKCKL